VMLTPGTVGAQAKGSPKAKDGDTQGSNSDERAGEQEKAGA